MKLIASLKIKALAFFLPCAKIKTNISVSATFNALR
jgi:hypothetical protein